MSFSGTERCVGVQVLDLPDPEVEGTAGPVKRPETLARRHSLHPVRLESYSILFDCYVEDLGLFIRG